MSAWLTFNLLDCPGVDQNGDKVVTPEEFAPAFERVYSTILQHFPLNSSGPAGCVLRATSTSSSTNTCCHWISHTCFPNRCWRWQMTSTLPEVLGLGHVHLVTVRTNGRVQEQILDSRNRTAFSPRPARRGSRDWAASCSSASSTSPPVTTTWLHLLGLLIATGSLRYADRHH